MHKNVVKGFGRRRKPVQTHLSIYSTKTSQRPDLKISVKMWTSPCCLTHADSYNPWCNTTALSNKESVFPFPILRAFPDNKKKWRDMMQCLPPWCSIVAWLANPKFTLSISFVSLSSTHRNCPKSRAKRDLHHSCSYPESLSVSDITNYNKVSIYHQNKLQVFHTVGELYLLEQN